MNVDLAISLAGGLTIAVVTCITVMTEAKNRKLKRRLRIALQDCLAFHRLETDYCARIVTLTPNDLTTVAAIQRAIRKRVRDRGGMTPSGLATPQQLQQEIRCL